MAISMNAPRVVATCMGDTVRAGAPGVTRVVAVLGDLNTMAMGREAMMVMMLGGMLAGFGGNGEGAQHGSRKQHRSEHAALQ